jgi:hypothetical protein
VNDIDEPIIAIQGQAVYSTIGQARLGSEDELANLNLLGAPAQEFTALYTLIFQSSDTYSNDPQARIRSTDLGDDYVDWRNVIISGGGITGSGDVVGPGSSTDNAMVLFDGVTGSVLKESALTVVSGVIAGSGLELTSPIINTILTATGKTGATFIEDGAAELYHAGVKKFETDAAGATITGVLVADGLTLGDNEPIIFGAGPDAQIYSDGTNLVIQNGAGDENMATFTQNGNVVLYSNGVKMFNTYIDPTNHYGGIQIFDDAGDKNAILFVNAANGELRIFNSQQDGIVSIGGIVEGPGFPTMATFNPSGSTDLYYAGANVIRTFASENSWGGISIFDEANAKSSQLLQWPTFASWDCNSAGLPMQITATKAATGQSILFKGDPDGAGELYHAGVPSLATISSGISIAGDGDDFLYIQHEAATSTITNSNASGTIRLMGTKADEGSSVLFYGDPDGAGELYHAGVKKFETAADGATVAGNIQIQNPPADDTSSGITISADVDTNTVGIGGVLLLGTDGSWDDADATIEATAAGMLSIAVEAATGTKVLLLQGMIQDAGTWDWTIGATLYLNTTVGQITETAPSGSGEIVRIIGYAMSADTIYFDPDKTYIEV